MNKLKFFALTFLCLVIVLITFGLIYLKVVFKKASGNTTEVTISGNNVDMSGNKLTENIQVGESITLSYPIDKSNERITLNPFGNYLDGKSSPRNVKTDKICPAGKSYAGYYTGTDLEFFDNELNADVSVKSIADGVVRQIGPINGYGGLIVIEHEISGKKYTAYYGHVNLSASKLKTGDQVKAGEQIANLAPECSSGNGFTRKHLHFGLRPGTSIDVRGYVSDQKTLNNWIDPKEFLDSQI